MARRAVLALLVVVLASPGAAQQATPGQVAYAEGLRAFDAGDYATAAARMRTALAEDPREGTERFRYRAQNREDYFPQLWLGLSLEKLGESGSALAALRESRRQGAVEARPALRRILDSALARLAPPTSVPTLPPPPPTAEPTRQIAAPAPTTAPTPAPEPTTGPTRIAGAARPSPVPSPSEPAREQAADAAAVRAGLRAFFRGDYPGAERLLAPEAGQSPLARVFLAYALGGRYLVAASPDAGLLERARSEYAAALLAGGPADGGPWVSPAILALFGAADPAR